MPPELVEGLGLAKACAKLGIAFWDYLGARLGCTEPASVPDLPQLVSAPLPHTRPPELLPLLREAQNISLK